MSPSWLNLSFLNLRILCHYTAYVSKGDEDIVRRLSELSHRSRFVEVPFDVERRQSLEVLMNTVAGDDDNDEEELKQTCRMIDVFESMVPHREKVGFLICCPRAMARFCNAPFKQITRGFIDEGRLHVVVGEMHIDLIALHSDKANAAIVRKFHSAVDFDVEVQEETALEIRATLLGAYPPMSLFVARRITDSTEPTGDEQNVQLCVGGVFRL